MQDIPQRFRQAVTILKQGEREKARKLLREILLDAPTYAPAWLWMSAVVEDVHQQRDCLQKTLELDPDNQAAQKGLEILNLQQFLEEIPENERYSSTSASKTAQARKLGEYLIYEGLITQEQLELALHEQREIQNNRQSGRVPLGDVLIKLNMLTADKLATVLVMQQRDKISSVESKGPEYLGEYLVAQGIISQEQLKEVLAVQIQLRQKGRNMLLGELLTRSGYVTPSVIESVLNQQLDDIFERFDEEED
jgi:tetratricopeptide (TPR) repeat protein